MACSRIVARKCSNGLLMIDYFAKAFGLAPINAYEDYRMSFDQGVNSAVAGATALPVETLRAKGLPSHAGNADVVQSIVGGVRTVIGFGATKVVVPGRFPVGCLPMSPYHDSLLFKGSPTVFDSNLCLKEYNRLAARHNDILKVAIEKLRKEHPDVAIVYADYYNAYLSIQTNAEELGFASKFSTCCVSGDKFNFSFDKPCGKVDSCPNRRNILVGMESVPLNKQTDSWLTISSIPSFPN
ncbi:OLC1v1030192C1 [Oldenlandia corymbosa var. corymbosa]|uniref:OLC1v1030192C1 n=1 Tax=Oldenlandia corymbosa var. corymbosa TaxID=529605 RepID=A0AAV1CHC9_OLDCO|nr:OLC1v1030192C1 [Oldenlandia corymbosa var. corymbosa]